MQESIKQIIMRRDGISGQQADNLIAEAREALYNYLEENDSNGAENICEEYFGLEPDYIIELM